jgi:hypothetical protein
MTTPTHTYAAMKRQALRLMLKGLVDEYIALLMARRAKAEPARA